MRKFFSALKISSITVAVAVLLIFLHYTNLSSPVENLFFKIVNPVSSSVIKVFRPLSFKIKNLGQAQKLITENKQLREKLQKALVDQTKLSLLIQENNELKKKVNFLSQKDHHFVSAQIVAWQDNLQFLIPIGSDRGLVVGLPVLVSEGIIVGKIIEVGSNFSKVLIDTHPTSALAGLILSDVRPQGLVIGDHQLAMKMKFIPQDQKINQGDLVVTSGLENNIPMGLLIGQIDQVLISEEKFYQEVVIKPAYQSIDLNIVSVILP